MQSHGWKANSMSHGEYLCGELNMGMIVIKRGNFLACAKQPEQESRFLSQRKNEKGSLKNVDDLATLHMSP